MQSQRPYLHRTVLGILSVALVSLAGLTPGQEAGSAEPDTQRLKFTIDELRETLGTIRENLREQEKAWPRFLSEVGDFLSAEAGSG